MTGTLGRLATSIALGVPVWYPDTASYLEPALAHPWLPFSEVRTAGFPLIVSAGLGLTGSPLGILLLHNLLWLVSTGALVLALGGRLRSPWPALLLASYLAFVQKNLAFELSGLSEHAARCLYDLLLALLVWHWRQLGAGTALGLAALTAANVFVKPTAVALVPVVLAALALEPASGRLLGRRRLRLALVYVLAVGTLLGGYAAAYRQRFGYWALSAFGGVGLYAHVGHLTDLDGRRYPEVLRELREFMPLFFSKYANSGVYMGDWLTFGSIKRECERLDFGDRSPREVVTRHARAMPGPETLARKEERIFTALAVDGIRAHPGGYALHVARSFAKLLVHGIGVAIPLPADWAASPKHWRQALASGQAAPGEAGPPSAEGKSSGAAAAASGLFMDVSEAFTSSLRAAGGWAAVLGLALALRRRPWRHPAGMDACTLGALAAAGLVAYGLLLAMVLVSEPPRFAANVQDLGVAAVLLVAFAPARD
ncbi:MAG TPA: hypothetical protein P5234_03335 [Thermoanaerobaculaceae bacterium]|nr:hypothetical protein [Thermoanaerobaculaceae bacterium]HRS15264.1 hypothetical protein [Thermoanaerobaculaceae bacterium]